VGNGRGEEKGGKVGKREGKGPLLFLYINTIRFGFECNSVRDK
jgi:hypothetical protein